MNKDHNSVGLCNKIMPLEGLWKQNFKMSDNHFWNYQLPDHIFHMGMPCNKAFPSIVICLTYGLDIRIWTLFTNNFNLGYISKSIEVNPPKLHTTVPHYKGDRVIL